MPLNIYLLAYMPLNICDFLDSVFYSQLKSDSCLDLRYQLLIRNVRHSLELQDTKLSRFRFRGHLNSYAVPSFAPNSLFRERFPGDPFHSHFFFHSHFLPLVSGGVPMPVPVLQTTGIEPCTD